MYFSFFLDDFIFSTFQKEVHQLDLRVYFILDVYKSTPILIAKSIS